jgi:geranylgeranyl diphosphate synthase, type I
MTPAAPVPTERARRVLGEVGAASEGRAWSPTPSMQDDFDAFVARVRGQIESRLGPWLDARVIEARSAGVDVEAVGDALRQLALRRGKRMRAVLLAAAYEACGGEGGAEAVAPAGLALELLQAYLLVHDDWMDGDEVRRGGPSVPAMMRARFGGPRADAMSVLAGDLAAAWAHAALLELTLAPERVVLAARELARVEEEVIQGQILDVGGDARHSGEVEAMHALKSASYSVRGPVVMGARLAGASEAQVAALEAFGRPLGVAFQLRDDVLGVFGDAGVMGKPAGNDLRAGKRTAIVVEAMRDPRAAELLACVLGRRDASEGDVRAAVGAIEACGARARVEGRLSALVGESRTALAQAALAPVGRALLARAVEALTERRG